MELAYFAWVREGIGRARETVSPPSEVRDVAGLIAWAATLSEAHAAVLGDPARLRAAVDDRLATPDSPIAGAREVAIFPPVTGG